MAKKTKARSDRDASVKAGNGDLQKRMTMLLEQRDQLIDQMRALSSVSLTADKQAGEELADVGSDDFMRETEIQLLGAEGERLSLIQGALKRIEDGSYGSCLDCSDKIPDGRLDAIPFAKYCINCKTIREANGGLRPDDLLPSEE